MQAKNRNHLELEEQAMRRVRPLNNGLITTMSNFQLRVINNEMRATARVRPSQRDSSIFGALVNKVQTLTMPAKEVAHRSVARHLERHHQVHYPRIN